MSQFQNIKLTRAERRKYRALCERKGIMRYLKDKEFKTALHTPFKMQNPKGSFGETKERATISDVIHWLLSSYQPSPRDGFVLNIQEIRRLNRIIDTLEREPNDDGFYMMEDVDWQTAKRVASEMAVILTPRNAPIIEDIFDEMPTSPDLKLLKKEKEA